jgi:hypothetical protein
LESGGEISTLDLFEIGFLTFIGGYMKIDLVAGHTLRERRRGGRIAAVERLVLEGLLERVVAGTEERFYWQIDLSS